MERKEIAEKHPAITVGKHPNEKSRLSWQVQNPAVMHRHDAYIVNLQDDLHLMYYGPDGYFDQAGCDVRLALFNRKLDNLARTK